MSALHNVLREIPDKIKNQLTFLELGYYSVENIGNNFENVEGFKRKTSVDMDNINATFTMLTDDFFLDNTETYDIIYIDAGHHWENVLKDYNNSIKALNDGGIIFFHDLYPTPELATPQYCGDGYKLLNYFYQHSTDFNFLTYKPDVGTTFLYGKFPPVDFEHVDQISYDEFCVNISKCGDITDDYDFWKREFLKTLWREVR